MNKNLLCCISIFALVFLAPAVRSAEQTTRVQHVSPGAIPQTKSGEGDCEDRMQKLDASSAEGQERLDEKNAVIDYCIGQYNDDKTIQRLWKECAKYGQQPVLKQQFVADCQLAAFNYANALYSLKAEYGK